MVQTTLTKTRSVKTPATNGGIGLLLRIVLNHVVEERELIREQFLEMPQMVV
jgi:hypothetical protein